MKDGEEEEKKKGKKRKKERTRKIERYRHIPSTSHITYRTSTVTHYTLTPSYLMSRSTSVRTVPLPIAHSVGDEKFELSQNVAIDINHPNSHRKKSKKTKSKSSSSSSSSSTSSTSRSRHKDTSESDDPYDTPPPAGPSSTVGDQFYDSFAALETKIATGSQYLHDLIGLIKMSRRHPDKKQDIAAIQEDQVDKTSALLTEIDLIKQRFNSLTNNVDSHGAKLENEEKQKRAALKERVNYDSRVLSENFTKITSALGYASKEDKTSSGRITGQGSSSYSSYDEEKGGLLDSSHDQEPDSIGLQYQHSEYIGDLDGHLLLLEEQAKERAQFMKQIEKDVYQVHDIFREMNQMVYQQGQFINGIEENIEKTTSNARTGADQLQQAAGYLKQKKKKGQAQTTQIIEIYNFDIVYMQRIVFNV